MQLPWLIQTFTARTIGKPWLKWHFFHTRSQWEQQGFVGEFRSGTHLLQWYQLKGDNSSIWYKRGAWKKKKKHYCGSVSEVALCYQGLTALLPWHKTLTNTQPSSQPVYAWATEFCTNTVVSETPQPLPCMDGRTVKFLLTSEECSLSCGLEDQMPMFSVQTEKTCSVMVQLANIYSSYSDDNRGNGVTFFDWQMCLNCARKHTWTNTPTRELWHSVIEPAKFQLCNHLLIHTAHG